MRAGLAPGVDAWAVSLRYLMGAVVVGGGVVLSTFQYMQKNIVPEMKGGDVNGTKAAPKKKKPKMTMAESAKFLMSSKYIRNLAMLVIRYDIDETNKQHAFTINCPQLLSHAASQPPPLPPPIFVLQLESVMACVSTSLK
jgi:hypothetical protein